MRPSVVRAVREEVAGARDASARPVGVLRAQLEPMPRKGCSEKGATRRAD